MYRFYCLANDVKYDITTQCDIKYKIVDRTYIINDNLLLNMYDGEFKKIIISINNIDYSIDYNNVIVINNESVYYFYNETINDSLLIRKMRNTTTITKIINVDNNAYYILNNITFNTLPSFYTLFENSDYLNIDNSKKYFLLLYGKNTTNSLHCFENMLKLLKNDLLNYDIYLFIDNKTSDVQNIYKKYIKKIWYIDDHLTQHIINDKVNKYLTIYEEIKKEFNMDLVANCNICVDYYCRTLFLNMFNNYCISNNVKYDYGVFTKLNVNVTMNHDFMLLHDYKLFIRNDLIFSGTISQLIHLYAFSDEYFTIYNFYKKYGKNITTICVITKLSYSNYEYNDFIKTWICMPEVNFQLYTQLNNIQYNTLYIPIQYLE